MRGCCLVLMWLVCCLFPAWAQECLIAIDAGHTRETCGATSARGVGEWHFNMVLAKKLAVSLEQQAVPYVLINPDGAALSLRSRLEIASKAGVTLFISLHHDAVQPHYLSEWEWEGEKRRYSDHFSGYSLFVSAKNPYYRESLDVASKVADGLLEKGLKPTLHHAEPIPGETRLLLDKVRGIYQFDELVVLKESPVPAVLVEAGVIVNRDEELLVSTPAYQKKWICALMSAIEAHCKRIRSEPQTGGM